MTASSTAEEYRLFARDAMPESPLYRDLCLAVSEDREVLRLLDALPAPKRQPNLLLAAVRYRYGTVGSYPAFRDLVVRDWPRVRSTMLRRRTQTNEPARCGALLPVLAGIDGPVALLEVGASAGLCLYPDRYLYAYGAHVVGPADSPVRIACAVTGDPPLPRAMPEVVWRGGVDLNPLDVRDRDDMRWLEALVWPGRHDRVERLRGAVAVAREEPPTLLRGDLFERLPEAVALVPEHATLVLFHTAVMMYLSADQRDRLARMAGELAGRWVAQEGARLVPGVAERLPRPPVPDRPTFVLAVDGDPVAYTAPHGGWLDWF